MRGLSAFVSAILIIAITLAVAGVFSGWFTGFVKRTSESIEEQSSAKIVCSNGGISLENVRYNQTSGNITGYIRNTEIIGLGNIDVEIFLANTTKILLDSNITLAPGEQEGFIYHLNTQEYDFIRVKTNCSNVYSQISAAEVSLIT